MAVVDPLERFHPAVATWFRRRFPDGPSEAQSLGWAPIAEEKNTLIAAPTGSGKTLAAFLVAIDRCLRRPTEDLTRGTRVIYVSPLRALTVDIKENLETPLDEITEIAKELGETLPDLRIAVRNGDTPASARAAMLRDKPEIVVTTPESLYLLVTARRGRELLATVDTVIVDEIHAIARDKRGSHLALTLVRLDRLVMQSSGKRPTRIGLSATQRPIETVARLLVGAGDDRSNSDGSPDCTIVDVGHRRALDVAITLTGDELSAVQPIEQMAQVVASIADEIRAHQTTLVFVNTRKMSERIAHLLAEELGEDAVAAHHGSLSTERRLSVERRLRSGELPAVVATASLELGIDVGPVELVCQLGSPRSIATFLQRVGRAEHRRNGVPKGRLYPMTRDELVESVALLGAVHEGLLDIVRPVVAPLDILSQQIVAECAASGDDGIAEAELLELVRHASPYATLADEQFEEAVSLVSNGIETGRGIRGAYVYRDQVNSILRPRRGARLVSATSGGAIPELADYRVIVEPDEVLVGTVHEDFAVEAMIGDVFLLGSTPWQVRRVVNDTVRVVDATGRAPTIPFWLGEAPARTAELADAICQLYRIIEAGLDKGGIDEAVAAVIAWAQVSRREASEIVAYLSSARKELGKLPSKEELIFERFFDDTGGMQLVIHSPFGARINRGFGLALRKRFCKTFDFELQAAANDDAIVLSLGPQHAFPLEDVPNYLSPNSLREVLTQAVLPTPFFTSRWRWNLSRSLVSPRFRGTRHLPIAIQRMEADDLMAAIFPSLAQCQENASGPIEVPDHLLVRQTLDDCMTEAMDLEGLNELVTKMRAGTIKTHCVDTDEPSLLCHEIISGRPFTFLDDAPLEERRTRAISLRRGVPIEARNLTDLDPQAIEEVANEVRPEARDKEELHDLLSTLVLMEPNVLFEANFTLLVATGRAMVVHLNNEDGEHIFWTTTERRATVEAIYDGARFSPDNTLRAELQSTEPISREEAITTVVRGQLDYCGPISISEIADGHPAISESEVELALITLESKGAVLRVQGDRWCARRLVARIHARQRDQQRVRNPAVSPQHYMRFLLDWQHVTPGRKLRDIEGLSEVIAQLQGIEVPVGAWEEGILSSRILGYQARLLDDLFARGEATWGRLSTRTKDFEAPPQRRSGATPSRATPVALFRRDDLAWLLAAERGDETVERPSEGATAEILEALDTRGALFFTDLCSETGRLPIDVAEALWDGVARGLVTADSFQAVRSLLAGRYRHTSADRRPTPQSTIRTLRSFSARRTPGPRVVPPALAGGRWSILEGARPKDFEPDELADAVAVQLLERWGVVFRDVVQREQLAISWREVLFALRRLEARGIVRGGYFVSGFSGEQFALGEALADLRSMAKRPLTNLEVTISAADPLNLTGIILAGPRTPAVRGHWITLVDGLPNVDAKVSSLRGMSAPAHS